MEAITNFMHPKTTGPEQDLYCVTTVLELATNVFRKKILDAEVEEANMKGRNAYGRSFKTQLLNLVGQKPDQDDPPRLDMKYKMENGQLIPMPKQEFLIDLNPIKIDLQINWRWGARARKYGKDDLKLLKSPIHRFLQWYIIEKKADDPFRAEAINFVKNGAIPGTRLLADNGSYVGNITGTYIEDTLVEKMETAVTKGEAAFQCKATSAFGNTVKEFLTLDILRRVNRIFENEYRSPQTAINEVEEIIDLLQAKYWQAQTDMLKVTVVE